MAPGELPVSNGDLSREQHGRRGDSLAEAIAALRPRLLSFAFSLTGDRELAADLTQETMARALGAAWRFTPGTNLKAWLFRIMRNLRLNQLRDAGRAPIEAPFDELAEELATGAGPLRPVEHEAVVKADLAQVMGRLNALPALFRLPVQLTAIEQLSYAEAAGVLGIPLGTVMSRIHRGRRMLIAGLAEERA